MTEYKPSFDIQNFELRGEIDPYLTQNQREAVSSATQRVSSQLDWLAQLLGWSGPDYWGSLVSSVDQKRQLLGTTFGIYNRLYYPEVIEINQQENSIKVKTDQTFSEGQSFFIGNVECFLKSFSQDGEEVTLVFDTISDESLLEFSSGGQLTTVLNNLIPAPFNRPNPGVSSDRSFSVKEADGTFVLHPSQDKSHTLPYKVNVLYLGGRYHFDKPLSLKIGEGETINPSYDFDKESWFVDVPTSSDGDGQGLTATLFNTDSSLTVNIKKWGNPSDWVNPVNIERFTGVWGNKGGRSPFHAVFDSLSLHGFDETKSVFLDPIERSIQFDKLLNHVYLQQVYVSPGSPHTAKDRENQVWWNSQTGTFSIYSKECFNCGPWVEVDYPNSLLDNPLTDFVFPGVTELRDYTGNIPEGSVVTVVDCSGLNKFEVVGISGTLASSVQASFVQNSSTSLSPLVFAFKNVSDFKQDCKKLPVGTPTRIVDSTGLMPSEQGFYSINNLSIGIVSDRETLLMKGSNKQEWFISPPSHLKYIGETCFFESNATGKPLQGELREDTNLPLENRVPVIFYYNRWEKNISTNEWELQGDWLSLDTGEVISQPPEVLNFSSILVYCDGSLLSPGVPFSKDGYQFTYNIEPTSGTFNFSYIPDSYRYRTQFPKITISDSITTSYTFDISDQVFSGLVYYMSPNVLDSETLLRIWKSEELFCIDEENNLNNLSFPNQLIADSNLGAGGENWEQFFIRLPPSYGRDSVEWRKVNTVCIDFSYWGSSSHPESMTPYLTDLKPRVYEEVCLQKDQKHTPSYIYSEPYLFSKSLEVSGSGEEFDNSFVIPLTNEGPSSFNQSELIEYEPLHLRRAILHPQDYKDYGNWQGVYSRKSECESLSGFENKDVFSGQLEEMEAPLWDTSIYKYPQDTTLEELESKVDANHYKIGYAFFCTDLSGAEEGLFDLSQG